MSRYAAPAVLLRRAWLRRTVLFALVAAVALAAFASPAAAQVGFFTVPPCRAVDTRNAAGPFGGPPLAAAQDAGLQPRRALRRLDRRHGDLDQRHRRRRVGGRAPHLLPRRRQQASRLDDQLRRRPGARQQCHRRRRCRRRGRRVGRAGAGRRPRHPRRRRLLRRRRDRPHDGRASRLHARTGLLCHRPGGRPRQQHRRRPDPLYDGRQRPDAHHRHALQRTRHALRHHRAQGDRLRRRPRRQRRRDRPLPDRRQADPAARQPDAAGRGALRRRRHGDPRGRRRRHLGGPPPRLLEPDDAAHRRAHPRPRRPRRQRADPLRHRRRDAGGRRLVPVDPGARRHHLDRSDPPRHPDRPHVLEHPHLALPVGRDPRPVPPRRRLDDLHSPAAAAGAPRRAAHGARRGALPPPGDLRADGGRDRGSREPGLRRLAGAAVPGAARLARRLPRRRGRRRRGALLEPGDGVDLAAGRRRPRPPAPAGGARAVRDPRRLRPELGARQPALRARELHGPPGARRLRQLPPAPRGRDAQPDDGPLPEHAGQRQGGPVDGAEPERELRAGDPAALLDRPAPDLPRRHAAARRQRPAAADLRPGHGDGPGAGLHRLELRRQRHDGPRPLLRPGGELPAADGGLAEPPLGRRQEAPRRRHDARRPDACSRI